MTSLPEGAMAAAAVAAAAEEEPEEAWAWTWGAGTDGQLGNGGFQDHHLPQPLLLPPRCRGRVSFIAGGGAHAIALTSDGEVFTWGRGTHGQLGHGNLENIAHPKFVKFFENYTVTCVSTGWNHSGFATDSGQLFMCGDGSFGQLGTGDNQSRNLPFEVSSFTTKHVEKLAFGMRHSLVLLKDNSVYGFGSGRRGQVGKSASKNQKIYSIPRLIDGFPNCKIVNLYANGDHSAALDESGQLYIWGRALVGEHDDDQPRAAFPSLSISQVALGWHHALVLSGGELYTIGAYRHQKCDPTVSEDTVAQQLHLTTTSSTHHESSSVSSLAKGPSIHGEQVTRIAAGTEHSAMITDSGALYTWGWGEHGQLGLGDTCDQVVPQMVNLGDEGSRSPASLGVYCGSGFTIAVNLA
ncbi:ultraviolet-B receptor UVR8 [Hordeum vulgare subsp. vulgare]|uniref:RCC1-like domain-containing protein n=1 Tax=Hordeum vulgare subsp. vulgare TaxID=112509 RepID=A0A8I7B5W7_HORVV|nr:ultraviolet-B receptor UVR8 [Hordeum vulgare subsp. vulgare]